MMDATGETVKGVPFNLAENVSYAIGAVVSKTLMKKASGTVTLFSFDAGQGLSEHMAPFDAMVYVLDGKAVISIGGKPHEVSSGEVIIMPANITHALQAIEQFKMLLIMIRSQ
jgi:quercetin dioxygenase-like cupin family protein